MSYFGDEADPLAPTGFEGWKMAVDDEVGALVGLSCDDLPDAPYRDWYDEGMSPSEAAEEVLQGVAEKALLKRTRALAANLLGGGAEVTAKIEERRKTLRGSSTGMVSLPRGSERAEVRF